MIYVMIYVLPLLLLLRVLLFYLVVRLVAYLFKILLDLSLCLAPPRILVSDPLVLPSFIKLTCGQNVTVPTLMGVETIIFECSVVDGTPPFTKEIYKDAVQLSDSFDFSISPASEYDFGTYIFYASNECDTTLATSTVILQGQLVNSFVL